MSGLGRLVTSGDATLLTRSGAEVEEAAARGEIRGGPRELGGMRTFLKCSPLAGKSRLRHALRHALRPGELPRLREYENLEWLRAHGFHAPRPLVAGAWFRRGLPHFQFLYTEAIEDARSLRELLERGPRAARAPALDELARELARLHALGFVHRDVYPRNLLVGREEGRAVIHFLDTWRGGARRGLRGPAYDLGCLMLHGATQFEPEETRRLFDAYLEERHARGAPAQRRRLIAATVRARRALVRRARREGRRRGVLTPVSESWEPPGAAPPASCPRPSRQYTEVG